MCRGWPEKTSWTYRANAFEIPFIATYAPSLWVSIWISSRVLDWCARRKRKKRRSMGLKEKKDCHSHWRPRP